MRENSASLWARLGGVAERNEHSPSLGIGKLDDRHNRVLPAVERGARRRLVPRRGEHVGQRVAESVQQLEEEHVKQHSAAALHIRLAVLLGEHGGRAAGQRAAAVSDRD